MKQLRRIISFLLVLTMVFGLIPANVYAVSDHPFTDVPKGKYYSEAAAYMYENGLIKGTTDTTFSPADECTRAMVVTILWRMEGEPQSVMIDTPFTDLTKNWYKDAVKWANDFGIVNGVDAHSFNPNGSITREQLATILYRYCSQFKGYDVSEIVSLDSYPDQSKVGKFARDGLSWAVASGLINGSNNNGTVYLDPKGNATRAQVATILMRFLKDVEPYLNGSVDYTVTFNSNGGSIVASQKVGFEEFASEPKEPVRSGYLFAGWCTDEQTQNPWFFNHPVERDMTLYAKWVKEPKAETYTRGQWLEFLLELNQISVKDYETELFPYFTNLTDHPYRDVVETAYGNSLLPDDLTTFAETELPVFDADAVATREFAAYTAVCALGFGEGHTIDLKSWKDYADITYPNEDGIAIAWNMLKLDNGYFHPNEPVDSADAALISATLDLINNSAEVTEGEAHEIVRFAEGALRLNQLQNYEVTELDEDHFRAVLPGVNAASIAPGTVLVLPANDKYISGIALKVVSITAENGSAVAQCITPDIQEVYSRIDYAGHATFDPEHLNDDGGVEFKYIPPENEKSSRKIYGGSTSILDRETGWFEFILKDKDFLSNDKDDVKIKGQIKVMIKIPDITAIVNMDVDKREFYDLLLRTNAVSTITGEITATAFEIEGDVYYDYENDDGTVSEKNAKRVELKRIPFQLGTTGLSADLVFYYTYSLKGYIKFTYEIEKITGVHFTNNTIRRIEPTCDVDDKTPQIELNASASAGLGAAAELRLLHLIDLAGYFVEIGLGITGKYTARFDLNPLLVCGEVAAYVYLKHGLDQYTVLGEFLDWLGKKINYKFNLKFDVLKNDSNNPLRWSTHTENMEWVETCSYGKGNVAGIIKDSKTGVTPLVAGVELLKNGSRIRYKVVQYGEFDYIHLSPGAYTLRISAYGYYPLEVPITIEKNGNLDLGNVLIYNCNDYANITGLVYASKNQQPLKNANVTIVPKDASAGQEGKVVYTDHTGNYACSLLPGVYQIIITLQGYEPMIETITVTNSYQQSFNYGLSEEVKEPEPTEPEVPDNIEEIYNEYLVRTAYCGLPDAYFMDPGDCTVYSLLCDVDQDGVKEGLVLVQDSTHQQFNLALDYENGKAVMKEYAYSTGGSMGGDYLRILKDLDTNRYCFAFDSQYRMMNSAFYREMTVYSDSFETVSKTFFRDSINMADPDYADFYADKVAKVKGETNLYVINDNTFEYYKINDAYVSQSTYSNNLSRYEDQAFHNGSYNTPFKIQ